MSLLLIVKLPERPVCIHCGARCGRRYHNWPIKQQKPDPWDGQSWLWPYNPFCTLRCALSYARKRYEGGSK